jgi:hypothetical protein
VARRPNVATKTAPAIVEERPIIMRGESVRGILAGMKSQTRRLRGLGEDLKVRLPYEVKSDLADLMPWSRLVAKPGGHARRNEPAWRGLGSHRRASCSG